MASISTDKKTGGRRILFVAADGTRKAIRLGKVPKKVADGVKLRVERLNAAAIAGQALDEETSRWVADLEDGMHAKLSAAGLLQARESEVLTEFVEKYIGSRKDVKPNTLKVWRQTLAHLRAYFGDRTPLRKLTRVDGKAWRSKLQETLAEASVRKHCGFAKHFLAEAVERGLIPSNPFAKLVSASIGNADRQYFVTRDEIAKVLDACPDAEWRVIVALSRFGGLRCPSEHLRLRWEDIHWDRDRMTVHSPKTERHAGGESRIVPIFPELRPYLVEAFEAAEPGTEYVVNRYRKGASNVRTQLTRIVKKAGLKPWPRITHNLRATRQTELEAMHPTHVVCSWIGNSPLVAHKHYLQVTDDDFAKAAQNPAQYTAATCSIPREVSKRDTQETPRKLGHTAPRDFVRCASTGADGNRTHRTPFRGFRRV
jgi:integrase